MRKILKFLFGVCMIVGVIIIVGVTGSSDLEIITVTELAKYGVLGTALLAIGVFGMDIIGGFEYED